MLLVRSLNEYDIVSDPLSNGIASKELIYNLTKSYYDSQKDKEYIALSNKEKDVFIREHIKEYLISHKRKLAKLYEKRNASYRKAISDLLDRHDPAGAIMVIKYMSSLQSHLNSGSRVNSNWISTSKSLDGIGKYYDKQDVHKVALIKTNTNGFIDSDRVLTMDVSSKEKIASNHFLYNKIDCDFIDNLAYISTSYPAVLDYFTANFTVLTNPKARGFNYAKSSREVCIYEYLPASHIIGLIEALQMDLIKLGVFNFDYFKLSREDQEMYLNKLKMILFKLIKNLQDPFMLYVFQELYLNNKNLKTIITFRDSKDKIIASRNKILSLAKRIPNIQIK